MSHVKNCWMGILLGALNALVPSRKSDITNMILRAMIAGNAACFLTGSNIVNAVHQILRCLMLRIVGHVFCVLGVSILFLSTILIFAFRISPTVWYLVFHSRQVATP
jgi:hypothetical protein